MGKHVIKLYALTDEQIYFIKQNIEIVKRQSCGTADEVFARNEIRRLIGESFANPRHEP